MYAIMCTMLSCSRSFPGRNPNTRTHTITMTFQAPTLTELDGLGTQFLHLTSIAQQLCCH